MTLSARDVAAELRGRLPGVGVKKLHKLLYYCQGHHLATLHTPLLVETVSAWDMGPVVGQLWWAEKEGGAAEAETSLKEAELNTVGYVLSRYGALSASDLEHLSHAETPWVDADRSRPRGGSVRIEQAALAEYFAAEGHEDADETPYPDAGATSEWLQDAESRRASEPRPDSVDDLQARLAAAS